MTVLPLSVWIVLAAYGIVTVTSLVLMWRDD